MARVTDRPERFAKRLLEVRGLLLESHRLQRVNSGFEVGNSFEALLGGSARLALEVVTVSPQALWRCELLLPKSESPMVSEGDGPEECIDKLREQLTDALAFLPDA